MMAMLNLSKLSVIFSFLATTLFAQTGGEPISLAGKDTASTLSAIEFASDLVTQLGELPVSVRLIDERLSTVSAQRGMHEAGRNTKQSRDAIDQAAAVVILEHALASERNAGVLVGEEVS